MRYRLLKILIAIVVLAMMGTAPLLVYAEEAGQQSPLRAISTLDLPRYMGTWHEIARLPNSFQKKCVGPSKAQYRIAPDGLVEVINQCQLADGKSNIARGQARQIGGPTSAMLSVRFAPAWLSFLPMVWGDYWVIDLDPAYQLVAVSEPKREYLWVLSRSPNPDELSYQALLQRLEQKGFNLRGLIRTSTQ